MSCLPSDPSNHSAMPQQEAGNPRMTTFVLLDGSKYVTFSTQLYNSPSANMEKDKEIPSSSEYSLPGSAVLPAEHEGLNETPHESDENDDIFESCASVDQSREHKDGAGPESTSQNDMTNLSVLEFEELKEYDKLETTSKHGMPNLIDFEELKEYAEPETTSQTDRTNLPAFVEVKIEELKEVQPGLQEDDLSSISDETYFDNVFTNTTENRVCLVKSYAWIKEEMLKSTAERIGDHLYQQKLISSIDLESIYAAKLRRDAVEILLKKILMGPDEIYDAFVHALGKEDCEDITEQLKTVQVNETDIEVFTSLEKSAEFNQPRPHSDKPRLTFTKASKYALQYWLNDRDVVDSINDHLLSHFMFRIDEHTNIADNSMDTKKKLRRLLETMQLCSEKIRDVFYDILELDTVCMSHVTKKLKSENLGLVISRKKEKRKSSSSLEDISDPVPRKRRLVQKCLAKSKEALIVQTIQRPGSNIRQKANELGLTFDNAKTGSIIIQMTPKNDDSWRILKSNCRSDKIKDFVPEIFRNNEADLEEGEYMFKFDIYLLPTPPYSPADKKVMFKLEAKRPISFDIEAYSKLLCQELEITEELLEKLKREKIVEDNIKQDLAKKRNRRSKIKFLLDEIAVHGEGGYNILKQYIRHANEYLYNKLVLRDAMKKITAALPEASNVTPRPTSAGREVRKEIFYSAEVVLSVKKTVKARSESTTADVEITCPSVISSECFFTDEEEQCYSDEEFLSLEESWFHTADTQPHKEFQGGKRKSSTSSDSADPHLSIGKKTPEDDNEPKQRETTAKDEPSEDKTSKDFKESDKDTKRDTQLKRNNLATTQTKRIYINKFP